MTEEVTIDKGIWWDVHNALVSSKENAEILLDIHLKEFPDSSKTTKSIERMYEGEISQLKELISYAENNGGLPF